MTRPLSLVTRSGLLAFLLLASACWLLPPVLAQSATATLSGTVEDERGAVIPGAALTVINTGTRLERRATTNEHGSFVLSLLPASTYVVRVESKGFAPVEVQSVVLNVNDQKALQIQLKAGNISEMVKIMGEAPLINESPAVGTVIDRQFVENLPLNGRNFQSLIALTPGVVQVSANSSSPGQFSVNGQRSNSNYFTVDGVSANIGVFTNLNTSLPPGQETSGSTLGVNALGGTQSLISVEALEEFKIQTSTYAAEFGRQPGGQVSMVTRSGTNRLTGSLFEYFRNDALDATNWFVNANRLPKAPLRQNQFGGTLGGPLVLPKRIFGPLGYDGRDRTFFFFSYEGLRLRLPKTVTADVPSISLRQQAAALVRPLLDLFPLPTGPENPATRAAQFVGSYSDPSTLNATSIRLDHSLGRSTRLFGRFSHAPSESQSRFLSFVNTGKVETSTLTGGITQTFGSRSVNDLRLNYSRNYAYGGQEFDDFGGGTPLPLQSLLPPGVSTSAPALVAIGFINTINASRGKFNLQRQVNVVDNFVATFSSHTLKFGVDYRRLTPEFSPLEYQLFLGFGTPASILNGRIDFGSVDSQEAVRMLFQNLSLYAQDTWRVNSRLTLDLGIRWEVNRPPRGLSGQALFTVTGVDDLVNARLAPAGTPLYRTTYTNFAPRIGLAYQLSQRPGWEAVVRGGFGVYYDLGSGVAANAAGYFPYLRQRLLSGQTYPLSAINASPVPRLSFDPPYVGQSFIGFDLDYTLPRTYQWSVSAEQSLGNSRSVSVAYVGAAGRRLLKRESIRNANTSFTGNSLIDLTSNAASSDYKALQVQYRQRLLRGFQAITSYSLSFSEDNVSSDVLATSPSERIDPDLDRGPSDFDVRHVFTAAATYDIPSPRNAGSVARALLGGWGVDAIVRAQSASPVNVTVTRNLGFGNFTGYFRPDLVPGAALYITDPTLPGGRRINPDAFTVSPEPRQGNLPRNFLQGFPLTQFDLSLRRDFRLAERIRLQLRADVFNVFNHPNFASPNGGLGSFAAGRLTRSSTFGRTFTMLDARLSGTGFNPLYQVGGPRSVQLSVRLSF